MARLSSIQLSERASACRRPISCTATSCLVTSHQIQQTMFASAGPPPSSGFTMTSRQGDFNQTNAGAAVSTLTKNSTPPGSPATGISCTRTPTTCPGAIDYGTAGQTDLVITETLTLGVGAVTNAVINTVT